MLSQSAGKRAISVRVAAFSKTADFERRNLFGVDEHKFRNLSSGSTQNYYSVTTVALLTHSGPERKFGATS